MQLSTWFHESMPLTSGLALSIPRSLLFLHLPTQVETAEAWLDVSGVLTLVRMGYCSHHRCDLGVSTKRVPLFFILD